MNTTQTKTEVIKIDNERPMTTEYRAYVVIKARDEKHYSFSTEADSLDALKFVLDSSWRDIKLSEDNNTNNQTHA